MKIVSWNVNGLRACINKGFMDFFSDINADIVCLQEIKMLESQLTIEPEGYYKYFNSAEKKGYSGTAVFTKTKPISVQYEMGIEEHSHEGRLITLEFTDFYLIVVYVPNSKDGLIRLGYRMTWEDDFRKFANDLRKKKPVIICGDMNVAHKEIDLTHPKNNRMNPGFTDEERAKMTQLLESGFVDTFRYFYPDKEKAYSWWSYRANARANNVGWRIDYFIVSEEFKDRVKDSFICPEIIGSDHCPVGIILQ